VLQHMLIINVSQPQHNSAGLAKRSAMLQDAPEKWLSLCSGFVDLCSATLPCQSDLPNSKCSLIVCTHLRIG
jgi:hypothetical protein